VNKSYKIHETETETETDNDNALVPFSHERDRARSSLRIDGLCREDMPSIPTMMQKVKDYWSPPVAGMFPSDTLLDETGATQAEHCTGPLLSHQFVFIVQVSSVCYL